MFEAKYKGTCSECSDAIEPGELVRYVDTELVHEHHGGEIVLEGSPELVFKPDQKSADRPTRFAGTSLEEMGY